MASSLSDNLSIFELKLKAGMTAGLKLAGELITETARGYIGQELPDWAPLAETTTREKRRLGYSGQISITDPLLRTGELRDSIGYSIDPETWTLRVGSTDPVAIWQEEGTDTIPPRPFLARAAAEKADEVAAIIEREITAALRSR